MTSPIFDSNLEFREPKSLQHAIRARSGSPFAPPHIEPLARPDGNETERRLERELSQILSRPPAKGILRPSQPGAAYYDIEPDEPPPRTALFVGPHFQNLDDESSSPEYGEEDGERTGDVGGGDALEALGRGAELKPSNTNWLRTARRARRNRKLRFAASWAITILVGGFIILVAAAILFGIPGGKFAYRKEAVLAATPDFAASPARAEQLETRWRLD